jgi:hypothetical protein
MDFDEGTNVIGELRFTKRYAIVYQSCCVSYTCKHKHLSTSFAYEIGLQKHGAVFILAKCETRHPPAFYVSGNNFIGWITENDLIP